MKKEAILAAEISSLHHNIHEAEKFRQNILKQINDIKKRCTSREITFSEYEEMLKKDMNGLSLTGWMNYYDEYIGTCEKKIIEIGKGSLWK